MSYLKKVAYQGMPGAYSDLACKKYFGKRIKTCPQHRFKDVFEKVRVGKCDFGMVPIENSIVGPILPNLDLLKKYDLNIVGEIRLKISHNLLVIPIENKSKTERLKMVKKVYSHPVALAQCQKFFDNHPWMRQVVAEDTAGSAKALSDWARDDLAAIASSQAAKRYRLQILEKGIETNKENFTRFVVIG